DVQISEEDVIVRGTRLQDVSQTAANIEQVTKIKNKDLRVFLDGIYIYDKKGEMA
ncbi:MAG: 50S ribosomal protein L6, partial [Nitrososphaeria archaeon]|nr:50S ribosomal protein L6 [Nitrososphaeria archaeon]